MTAEDAIKLLSNTNHLHETPNGYYEALDIAIQALKDIEDGKYVELDEELRNNRRKWVV